MVRWTSPDGIPQQAPREVYYQQATLGCDFYCSETWRSFGVVAWVIPQLVGDGFLCWYEDLEACNSFAEVAGTSGPDFLIWGKAESDFYGHRMNGDHLYYPSSAYPLGG
jgi:hypothetical protein